MARGATQELDETGITQVIWEKLDLTLVWKVFPGAKREPSLDDAFKEGSSVFTLKDAYGTRVYAFIDDHGDIRSHGSHNLLASTIDSLKAAGAVVR